MSTPVYQWQPSTAEIAGRAGLDPGEVIRFDHNTSPRRPPWVDGAAAGSLRQVNEYPAADYMPLRDAAASVWGVDSDRIVPGAGVDELILLLAKAFVTPGSRVVTDTPTYPLYRIATLQFGGNLVEVLRDRDLEYPVDRMISAARGAELTWLCVPHNPVGDRLGDDALEAIITAAGGLVVVDAAYAEFAGDRWGEWVDRHESLVVLHTMSKAYGLAGIRVGYSVSSPAVAQALHRVRPPGSVSSTSQALAVAALCDPGWLGENVAAVVADREDLAASLAGIGLAVLPSATNFVLTRVGPQARPLMQRLIGRGLVVRAFPSEGPLAEYLRFTVRTPRDHARLVSAIQEELQ